MGSRKSTSGVLQLTRAPSIFESKGQSKLLLDIQYAGSGLVTLGNEFHVYIRSFISLWSKEDMKSSRGCGDEGRYRGVWSR